MKNILSTAADAFNNPNSPIYYIVGVIFLVAIIGALVVYIVLSNRAKKKADAQKPTDEENSTETPAADADETAVAASETSEAPVEPAEEPKDVDESAVEEFKSDEQSVEAAEEPVAEEEPAAEEKPIAEKPKAKATSAKKPKKKPAEAPTAVVDEPKKEEPPAEAVQEPEAEEKPAEAVQEQKAEEPEKDEASKTEEKPAAEEKSKTKAATGAKKPAAKSAGAKKPFIDRLLATKAAHGVYNSVKNMILSYPGIKAKLDKEGEGFFFGADKKAAIALDGSNVELYLALDPSAVPSQFAVTATGDAALPVKLVVKESEMDSAQRLIVYAMNVSMLSRNDRHRYVDYVQKAQEAKQRAKKK